MKSRLGTLVFVPLLAVLLTSAASAVEFKGPVVLKVGASATSSFGKMADILAASLGQWLPGKPTVDIEYVDGASGLQLAQELAATETGDGSVVALMTLSSMRASIIAPDTVKFDPAEIKWLAALTQPKSICVTDVNSNFAVDKSGLIFGATNKSAAGYVLASYATAALGLDSSIVAGFKTELEVAAALSRGEIDIYCGTYTSYVQQKRQDSQKVVLTFGPIDGVEGARDILADANAARMDQWNLLSSSTRVWNVIALPAAASPEIVEAYESAIANMVKDPGFVAAVSQKFPDFAPLYGEDFGNYVTSMHGFPAETVEAVKGIVGK